MITFVRRVSGLAIHKRQAGYSRFRFVASANQSRCVMREVQLYRAELEKHHHVGASKRRQVAQYIRSL